ncbi:hypothetical protein CHLRE_06g272760v5 [Chlamydomonas reinhardtii]|uniref:Uncharacterized protein n=1 Tax=Chlamydomonas reinhardtii TaxID=3055 RepID=A0A2K3DNF4_CHLRE|nr:uncharacterized protein CHLRE_06g272760v5 [Chlamydomonas reinhardtii]PNW82076.1 hypothetical protein CHLRE_06g272760v5 [Chlamydomonas reinhardtii]
MWCCKGGRSAVLLPTARFATAAGNGSSIARGLAGGSVSGGGNGSSSSYGLWLSSLICNVHPTARLLEAPPVFLDGVPSIRQLNALAAGLPLGGGGAAGGAGGGSGAGGGAAGGRAGGGGGGGGGPTTESHTGHPTRPGQPLKLSGAPQPPELVVRPEEEWDVVPAVVVTAAPAAAVAAVAVEATGVLGAAVQPHAAAGAQQQQQQRGPRGCRGSWR